MRRNKREKGESWAHYRNKYGWKAARLEHRREWSAINYKQRKEQGYKKFLIPTNAEKTEGFENHHINKTFVVSLPFFIHRQVPHSLRINPGMIEANEIALNYLLGIF